MRSSDIFSMAIRNLFKRKMRTSLTVLGVVVGTAAIVVMISLGIGVNLSFEKQLKQMNDITIINMYSNAYYSDNKNARFLREEDIQRIMQLDGVVTASGTVRTNLAVLAGKYTNNIQITGIRPDAMVALGYKTEQGRTLTEDDKFGIVFGAEVPYEFLTERERRLQEQKWRSGRSDHMVMLQSMGPRGDGEAQEERPAPNVKLFDEKVQASFDYNFGRPPQGGTDGGEGQTPKPPIKPYRLETIGILEKGNNYRTSYFNYMHIDTVKQIVADKLKYDQAQSNQPPKKAEDKGYEEAFVKCKDIDSVAGIIEQIKDMGFQDVYSEAEYIMNMKKTAASLQALLGAVGAVSLFVAAIGIANTMVMSIYERTREIGVMKVIGAALKDIRSLFLLEAAAIGFMGGVLGIGLSLLVSYVLNNVGIAFFDMFAAYGEDAVISSVPAWLCGAALAFSCVVGLVSGYFPARRAMKISALSAIRTE